MYTRAEDFNFQMYKLKLELLEFSNPPFVKREKMIICFPFIPFIFSLGVSAI